MAEPTTPTTNGVKTPVTPQQHYGGFSLTEYSAQPSPPSSKPKTEEAKVPKEFLLPSGYPDVRTQSTVILETSLTTDSISASSSHPESTMSSKKRL
jgi:hypothetical protein